MHVDHMTFAELEAELKSIESVRAWGPRFYTVSAAVRHRGNEAWRNYDVFGTPESETLAKSDALALDRKARGVIMGHDHNGQPIGEVALVR